nr:hypothetical protein [Burkholderia metallica]
MAVALVLVAFAPVPIAVLKFAWADASTPSAIALVPEAVDRAPIPMALPALATTPFVPIAIEPAPEAVVFDPIATAPLCVAEARSPRAVDAYWLVIAAEFAPLPIAILATLPLVVAVPVPPT